VARFAACAPRALLIQTETTPARTFLGHGTINFALGRDINALRNRLAKRIIDLALGIPALVPVLPVIGILVFAIKLFSPGPAFYTQARVGLRGGTIHVLKLRTMRRDADKLLESYLRSNAAARFEWDRFCKLSHDPRVLPYSPT
jgi:lipopolysaccharide/colanic/teichoic acid biosynthesis glycosyltransferase